MVSMQEETELDELLSVTKVGHPSVIEWKSFLN